MLSMFAASSGALCATSRTLVLALALAVGVAGAQTAAEAGSTMTALARQTDGLYGGAISIGYKKNNNAAIFFGGAAAAAAAIAIYENSRPKKRYTSKKPSKKPTQKKEYAKKKSQPSQRKLECEGGTVRSGECICDEGYERQSLGNNAYVCAEPVVAEVSEDYAPDEVLTSLPIGTPQAIEEAIAKDFNLELLERFESELAGERVVLLKIKDGQPVEKVVAALNADQRVVGAQPNFAYVQQGAAAYRDGEGGDYAFAKMELQEAQRIARGRGVLVALIDSSVDVLSRELKGGVAGTYDATNQGFAKPDAHTTAIAGILVASGGANSVAPEAKLLCIKAVFEAKGGAKRADSRTVGKAMEYAMAQNARIVLLPLLARHDPLIERIIRKAASQQALIVAPAGNKGPSAAPAYPGAYEDVVAVTATDSDDAVYEKANQGGYVALAAPGVDIFVLQPDGDTAMRSGTSYAAAHATGVAALLLGYDPQLTVEGVRTAMGQSAVDLGRPGKDQIFGEGLVSAASAMRALRQKPPAKTMARPVKPQAPGDAEPVSVGSIDRK